MPHDRTETADTQIDGTSSLASIVSTPTVAGIGTGLTYPVTEADARKWREVGSRHFGKNDRSVF